MELQQFWTNPDAKPHIDRLDSRYSAILDRFRTALRYVDLHPDHARTFSYEFASILSDSANAFSVFTSALIRVDGDIRNERKKSGLNINDFHDFYAAVLPGLPRMYTDVANLSAPYRLQPFWGWNPGHPPTWWTENNKLKHSDLDAARHGNLRNATHGLAALSIVLQRVTQHQKGRGYFTSAGDPWNPKGRGMSLRLFDPESVE